jgi:importin subunit beta-1
MKEAILATLNSPHSLVRAQVANVIAAICGIEIPRGLWPEIIPMLCVNAEHNDYHVKLASLMTLGYICEEI